jgi:hexosaminidase
MIKLILLSFVTSTFVSADPRTYLYFPSSDVMSTEETIFPQCNQTSTADIAKVCDETPGCIGFNSNGWLKNGSSSLAPYPVDLYLLQPSPPPADPFPLWPMPVSITSGTTNLVVSSSLTFSTSSPSPDLTAAFSRFTNDVFKHGEFTGEQSARKFGTGIVKNLVINVKDVTVDLDLGVDESYEIQIPSDGSDIEITSLTIFGALHGLTTLSQLVRFDFDALAYWIDRTPIAITDFPKFVWRGLMIDPARQYLPPITLRAVVDSMTVAKLNSLHVHILDCDSFPIQVDPPFENLWAGAFSSRERYTFQDLSGLVEYARQRGVRVIFEFDSPGHMGSMCVGYPDLCPTPTCDSSYGSFVLDPSSSITLPAMTAIIDTLVTNSIDSVIHLGGDEVSDKCWLASPNVRAWMADHNITTGDEIYEYFVQKSNEMAFAKNRSPMRWEEVWTHFKTDLDPRTIIHAWLSTETLFEAASAGYRTVFSVNNEAYYLDYLNVQWNAMYEVDILQGLTNETSLPFILGGEAAMWGETVDASNILSVVWPRAAAVAERLWSYNFNSSKANDHDTINRLSMFRCLLTERGVPATLQGAVNAGDMRPSWTVGSCLGGYKHLC